MTDDNRDLKTYLDKSEGGGGCESDDILNACLTARYSLSIIDYSPISAQTIGFQCAPSKFNV